MSILCPVESHGVRGRLFHLAVILALSLGGLTMVYPFAVMISGSFRSEMDETTLDLVPAFWHDDAALYNKFLETKYHQDVTALNRAHLTSHFRFGDVPPPDETGANLEAFTNWLERGELPRHWQVLGGSVGIKTVPENLRRLRDRLERRYAGDVEAFSRDFGSPITSWGTIVVATPRWSDRRYDVPDDPVYDEHFALMRERPAAERQLVSLSGAFLEKMIYPVDGQTSTDGFNRRFGTDLKSYDEFRLPRTAPAEDEPALRRAWVEFVYEELNPSFVVTAASHAGEFREMLAETYPGGIAELNRAWRSGYERFDDVPLPRGEWLSGQRRLDYEAFLRTLSPEALSLVGPEYAWADHLRDLGHDVDASAAGPPMPPLAALEWRHVLSHASNLRWSFSIRNYVVVWDELVNQGNALRNTVVVVLLAIVLALLINPLAAYALSRYQLPGTYKILLFLMATMAFPPMVTMIPQFIVLENLNLFNTFIALLLPLIVNGYMVFLLKGFFDSLPRELYEAARIDGAGELRMFFVITMALSQPILAVLALSTFTHAYVAFLYPLLVAPDEDMWLISVWLYQFQQRSSTAGVFASVIVASLPTLVIFLFVQRTIMRGIVVPTEK